MTNKYCYNTSSRIMKNTFSCIITIFICHYISSYIMTTNIVLYNEKYIFMYNNIYFYYIRSYIMKINIIIHRLV